MQTNTPVIDPGTTVFLLAAGKGTRLKPLTEHKPKALLRYQGIPMIDHVIFSVYQQGFRRIVVNVHHFADQLVRHLEDCKLPDLELLISDERMQLMDTGGALVYAKPLLQNGRPVLVHNVDILSDIDLVKLYRCHLESGAMATLAVTGRSSSRSLLFDRRGFLAGWRHNETGEMIIVPGKHHENGFAFSGIHLLSSQILDSIEKTGPFSMITEYLSLAEKYPIMMYDHSGDSWTDMASVSRKSELS